LTSLFYCFIIDARGVSTLLTIDPLTVDLDNISAPTMTGLEELISVRFALVEIIILNVVAVLVEEGIFV